MSDPRSLELFVDLLEELDIEIQKFLADDAAYTGGEWSAETLWCLVKSIPDYPHSVAVEHCRSCQAQVKQYDPLWPEWKNFIRQGLGPLKWLSEELLLSQGWYRPSPDNKYSYPLSYDRALHHYTETRCRRCRDRKRQLDDTEIECHPGLLNIDL